MDSIRLKYQWKVYRRDRIVYLKFVEHKSHPQHVERITVVWDCIAQWVSSVQDLQTATSLTMCKEHSHSLEVTVSRIVYYLIPYWPITTLGTSRNQWLAWSLCKIVRVWIWNVRPGVPYSYPLEGSFLSLWNKKKERSFLHKRVSPVSYWGQDGDGQFLYTG